MSQLQKHERHVLQAVRGMHGAIVAWYDKSAGHGHPLLIAKLGEVQVQTRISCSPGVGEQPLARSVTRCLRQQFAAKGVVL